MSNTYKEHTHRYSMTQRRKFTHRPNAWKSTKEQKEADFKREQPKAYAEMVKRGIFPKEAED